MPLREDYLAFKQDMINIANAIREKKGIKKRMKLDEMAKILEKDEAILTINSSLASEEGTNDYILYQIAQGENMVFEDNYSFSDTPQAQTLKYRAFYGSVITSLDLASITKIEKYACCKCLKLNSVNAPNVTHINNWAFDGCKALKKITLPKAEYIGDRVFNNSGAEEIYLPNNKLCVLGGTMGIVKNLKIYVPTNLIIQYEADPNWGKYTILSIEEMEQ